MVTGLVTLNLNGSRRPRGYKSGHMSRPTARNPQPTRLYSRRLSKLPVAANDDDSREPNLRLAPSIDPEADGGANSLLMELYAHIQALEAERPAEQG